MSVELRRFHDVATLHRECEEEVAMIARYVYGASISDYRSGSFFNAILFLPFGCIVTLDVQSRRSIVAGRHVGAYK